MTCVALLRAVTLSSVDAPPRRLRGATLLATCQGLGWADARLYASSGNAVFSGPSAEAGGEAEAAWCVEASRRLEDALAARLGARIPVTVVAARRLTAALRDAPPPAHADEQPHFTILFSPATACQELDALAARSIPDTVSLLPSGDVVLVRCAMYSRCRASNVAIELPRRAGNDAEPRHCGGARGDVCRRSLSQRTGYAAGKEAQACPLLNGSLARMCATV